MWKKIGPGVLVAAAFIGPGTVTLCTVTGVNFGYSLLWTMLLAIFATIFLQEMAARIGIVSQKGLADVIKENIPNQRLRTLAIILIMSAIIIGNAAYEGGNIGGATLGMEALFGSNYSSLYPLVIGVIAFALLFLGSYKTVEKSLVTLVILMSVSFLVSAIMTKPDWGAVFKGAFIPSTPEGSLLTIIGLIGTTVVPYNLFLHASLVSEKWKSTDDLKYARIDTVVAILLGGIVSMSIIVSAAMIKSAEVSNAADLAMALEPLYGSMAKYFIGIGLFAAGITSAITAPLAAAYVANSCFGWEASMKDLRFKATWMFILALGVFFLSFNIKPIQIIQFAQVANGILLPVIAILLVWIVNNKKVMGQYRNSLLQNIISILIILFATGIGLKGILKVIGIF